MQIETAGLFSCTCRQKATDIRNSPFKIHAWYCQVHSFTILPFLNLYILNVIVPVKEEEKRKLLKRSSELRSEHRQLEEKDRLLNNAVKVGLLTDDSVSRRDVYEDFMLEKLIFCG